MKNWFTADQHFNHANVIKYCNRPFKDVNDMNNTIIKRYNERVKDDDIVFMIGDFLFRNSPGGKKGEGLPQKADFFMKKLKGYKIPIKGNHDRNNSLKTPIEKLIIRYGGHRICLVHNPAHADPSFKLNFVGHKHEKWKFKKLDKDSYMINVGVDQWDFKPVSTKSILKYYNKIKSGK